MQVRLWSSDRSTKPGTPVQRGVQLVTQEAEVVEEEIELACW